MYTMAAAPPAPISAYGSSALATAWPRSAQVTAAFIIGAVTALLTINALGYWRGSKPSELERGVIPAYRIDLNAADRAELLQLPGVGPAIADRLESYRREHGPFQSVDELTRVQGVGPTTRERLRPWVSVRPGSGANAAQPPARKISGGKKTDGLKQPIDVNHASAAELQHLPRIGPKLAQRIIDERQKAPFQSVTELRRVSGIGPKTLELLRPYVIVNPANQLVLKGES
jgi:competence protein ComEA